METYYLGGPVPATWDKTQCYSHTVCSGVLDGCYHYSNYSSGTGSWVSTGMNDPPMSQSKMARVEDPCGTLQLMEGIGLWNYDWWDSSETWGPDMWNIAGPMPYYPDTSYTRRHRNGQTALMCDGTAKWVQTEDTAGITFSTVFHQNHLDWNTVDIWYDTYRNALYANGVGGMWTTAAGD